MSAFPTTRWSLIRASRQPPADAAAAWAALVRDYRPAIVAYFRRGPLARDAEDLAQEFLLRSMRDGWWARADADIGSFRRFLYALLKRFLLNRTNSAQQRHELMAEPIEERAATDSPDAQFDLQFALCLTQGALATVRDRYARDNRAALFAALEPWLAETPASGELAAIAMHLQVAPNTLAVQLRRLRQRLQQAIRDAIAELCLDPAQAQVDLAALRQALSEGA